MTDGEREAHTLLESPLRVVNVGLEDFARELESLDVPVVQVDWSPPAGGDPRLAALLSKLGT
ncbi:MAG: hypothetical protein GWN84_10090 [Gammaproteobacteria bacterium]|nr:hypothetical protein [Gammaproteobacteria bacterium]NIR83214.1 hypothetical protein [Gammaproteobacteria bacterium]NIR91022.1 hypothetical protein [Gammaproteobacteria bacterium]NIU04379.1 hypothetical protein [Gammaproteobacteria bacterium]NIV52602.1 hypothetical protein [Gammaproteobacteria bacterium]